jgi:hypothetical protein
MLFGDDRKRLLQCGALLRSQACGEQLFVLTSEPRKSGH